MKKPHALAAIAAAAALLTVAPAAANAAPSDSSSQISGSIQTWQNSPFDPELLHGHPVAELPHDGPYTTSPRTGNDIVSPHGSTAQCQNYKGVEIACFQQMSNGQWMPLIPIAGHKIYPVWDDPASVLQLLPAEYRDQAAAALHL